MHEELPEALYSATENPRHPSGEVESRREFLKDAITGTAALTTSLIPDMATAQQHDDHAKEHAHHPDMAPLLAKELAHPFNQKPGEWLDAHEKEWQECFDCSNEPVTEVTIVCIDERMLMQAVTQSGKRTLRMAGSGVLWKNVDELVDALVAYISPLTNGRPLSAITMKISSHLTCGAAGIAFEKAENPDKAASDFQRDTIVEKLKARGVNAVFTGNAGMSKGPHTGIAAAVDCTDGRLQRLPGINAFIISSPGNVPHAIEEAMLALKIATGSHAYGEKLKQFTFVVFDDPARPEVAKEIIATLRQQTQEYTAKGMDIRFVTRKAPAAK